MRYHLRRVWRRVRLWLADRLLWLTDRLVQDDPWEAQDAVRRATVKQVVTHRTSMWRVEAESESAAWEALQRTTWMARP